MTLDISVLDDDFDEEPVESSYGSYGSFQLVGHGNITSDACGRWLRFKGCIRTDLHDHISLSGENFKGKVFVRVVHHSCDKPSCPVCFKSGWAVRQAGKIEGRLAQASKRFGQVEHIVASVPVRDYGLSFEALRLNVAKALYARGVVGGVLIFHGFRYNLRHAWYWSPHFHVLGYILGGYGCRGCKKGCVGCNGFEGRTRREFQKDGYIVKVLDKRKTVFGTAWYQLNHATIKPDVRRFHVATWFGNCSYHKLKVTVEKRKDLCPICSEELAKLRHLGVGCIVKVKGEEGYVGSFVDDLVGADGSPNWCEASSGGYG
jgi:hypothetical protein